MKNFNWNNPMTRKDYAVLCGVSLLISAIIIIASWWNIITGAIGNAVNKRRKKKYF